MVIRSLCAVLLVLLVPVAANAQVNRTNGITVQGVGVAEGPARTIKVNVLVRGVENIDQDFLSAMRAAGVTDGTLTPPPFGQNAVAQRYFRGTMHDANRERLTALERAMQSFAATHRGVGIDSTQYFGDAADCPALEQRARLAAFEDAKSRAQALATLSGVSVGTTTNVSESGGCGSATQQMNNMAIFGVQTGYPIDAQTLIMRVTMIENMTFELVKKP